MSPVALLWSRCMVLRVALTVDVFSSGNMTIHLSLYERCRFIVVSLMGRSFFIVYFFSCSYAHKVILLRDELIKTVTLTVYMITDGSYAKKI